MCLDITLYNDGGVRHEFLIREPCSQIIFLIQLNFRMLGVVGCVSPLFYETTDLFKHATK